METNGQEGGSPGRTSQMLMQMMSQMTEQMQALRDEREADREAMQLQIQALQSAIATPTPTPQPQRITRPEPRRSCSPESAIVKKKSTLPDPPRFEGTRSEFRPWLSEMKNKLRVDGPVLGSRPDQFAYIYARLGGTPQRMTIAYVEAKGNNGESDPDHYLQYLEECYGDRYMAPSKVPFGDVSRSQKILNLGTAFS